MKDLDLSYNSGIYQCKNDGIPKLRRDAFRIFAHCRCKQQHVTQRKYKLDIFIGLLYQGYSLSIVIVIDDVGWRMHNADNNYFLKQNIKNSSCTLMQISDSTRTLVGVSLPKISTIPQLFFLL